MTVDPEMRPRLRPVEAAPIPDSPGMIALHDPSGLSPTMLTVSEAVVFVISHFDGEHTVKQAGEAFARQFGKPLSAEQLGDIVTHLQQAYLLDDEAFEDFFSKQVEEYRAAPARVMRSAEELCIDRHTGRVFDALMADAELIDGNTNIVGLIAPHLDYPRGAPCYAAAYAQLRNRPTPRRIIILGTNHFGQSCSVVATGKDFETPLGTVRTDVEFIERLESRCGDLREHEFDHHREHSVELQAVWCQHLFDPDSFSIVPVLCPNACGPTGTKPLDGEGVDMRDFAAALHECITQDGNDTLVIAGADLSHIGAHFGDDRRLDDIFLPEVRERDGRVLRAMEHGNADQFLAAVAADGNPTRICSSGCMYTILAALPGAAARSIKYHQSVHEQTQTGVTCAAVLLTR